MKRTKIALMLAVIVPSVAVAGELGLQLSTKLGKFSGSTPPAGSEYKSAAAGVGAQYKTETGNWTTRYTAGVTNNSVGDVSGYLQATSEYKVGTVKGFDVGVGIGTQVTKQTAFRNDGSEVSKTKFTAMPVASITKDNVSVQVAYVPSSKVEGIKVPGQVMFNLNIGFDSNFKGTSKSSAAPAQQSVAPVAVPSKDESTSSSNPVASEKGMSGLYTPLPTGTASKGEIYAPLKSLGDDSEVYSPLRPLDPEAESYEPLSYKSGYSTSTLAMLKR